MTPLDYEVSVFRKDIRAERVIYLNCILLRSFEIKDEDKACVVHTYELHNNAPPFMYAVSRIPSHNQLTVLLRQSDTFLNSFAVQRPPWLRYN